jgi:hypothetical protein
VIEDISLLRILMDAVPSGEEFSPRLAEVLSRLPKYSRGRSGYLQVTTLSALLALKRSDLARWKNIGKKFINDLAGALAIFGLSFQDDPPVRAIDANVQRLHLWIDGQLEHLEKLTLVNESFARERDLLTNVMLVLDGRDTKPRRTDDYPATLEDRCRWIADAVVPGFRKVGPKASCSGPTGKRWQAAWDSACIALGGVPSDFHSKKAPP